MKITEYGEYEINSKNEIVYVRKKKVQLSNKLNCKNKWSEEPNPPLWEDTPQTRNKNFDYEDTPKRSKRKYKK